MRKPHFSQTSRPQPLVTTTGCIMGNGTMNVFVYGTLRAGETNDIRVVASKHNMSAPILIGNATLVGRLYDFGAYPGLVIDSSGVSVVGEVYEIVDALVPVLDEIERVYPGVDGLFCSREATVVAGSTVVPCRFYPVSQDIVNGLPEIRSGDWVAYRRTRSRSPEL
jgi:gamma-glutamylcyclotransferase (GGCT)/AIG2-like uncharacterized protein YtfP